jgi:hypothetical protein
MIGAARREGHSATARGADPDTLVASAEIYLGVLV